MESLRELYRIGPGPSSSHSLGVRNACVFYHSLYPNQQHYLVELYGSLALTGKGHMSDKVIQDYFGQDHVDVLFKRESAAHPNTMILYGLENGERINKVTIYSIGGGAIEVEGMENIVDKNVYPQRNLSEILDYCQEKNLSLADYVYSCESDIKPYLLEIVEQMLLVVEDGLTKQGYLPGELHLQKIAKEIYQKALECNDVATKDKLFVTAYAYAAMEQSSCGEFVVTAPTLGSSGIVSALVKYYFERGKSKEELADGLAVAGVIGNVVKTNATISGAVGGCQAEIGTACAMGAAFASYLEGLDNKRIEYAAEIGMEHNLGLTCDPVGGYVQIPCIERNGVGVLRSLDAMNYAKYLGQIKDNKVSFDMVVEVMNYTGKKIPVELKETSLGGLAIEVKTE